jgi:lysozyme family protein
VVLRAGARGAAVRRLQAALGIRVDGAFGPQTHDAVVAFQRRHDLSPDGVVGAKTWAKLAKAHDAKPPAQPTVAPSLRGIWHAIADLLARLFGGKT